MPEKSDKKCVLALDTAMNGCAVGLSNKAGEFFSCVDRMHRGQAEQLMPMVEALFKDAEITPQDLEGIICTKGPGTFTGLRLALSVAKTMGQSLGVPVHGISTIDIISAQVDMTENYAVILETKRKDFYIGIFDGPKTRLSQSAALDGHACVDLLKKHNVKTIVGDAGERFVEATELKGLNLVEANITDPKTMLNEAQNLFERDEFGDQKAIPLYLRPADVSVSKKKMRKIE